SRTSLGATLQPSRPLRPRPRPRSKPRLPEESVPEVFRRMADDFERGGSKLYGSLARSLADDPVVASIVGEHMPRWEAPLRLFGGVHYLELSGVVQHPWPKLRGVLEANRDWLTRFVAEHPVQTNEVQRCWGLL